MTTPVSAVLPVEPAGAPTVNAGYGVSLTDVAAFEQAISRAQAAGAPSVTVQAAPVQAPSQAMQALFRPLEHINVEASTLSAQASSAAEGGRSLTPGEMVMLTVKCHEFMFHCQLTANAANRTSEGLQQLFRQQA
jgi:ABC-type sugar transport system substrate-binding protein